MENKKFKALRKFRECFMTVYAVIAISYGIIGIVDINMIEYKGSFTVYIITLGLLLPLLPFFVSINDINFGRRFVQIAWTKIKYSAFNEVYISKDGMLSLCAEDMKIIGKTTLKLFNEEQIKQIIKEFINRNKTVIDHRPQATEEKTNFSQTEEKMKFYTKNTGWFILPMVFFGMAIPYAIFSEDAILERILVVFVSLILILGFSAAISSGKVYFDADYVCFSGKSISLPSVSKVKITNDNNLIFYSSFNDSEDSFDLDEMRNNDAQKFINILSRKVPLSIAPEIAREKNYTLPEYAIKETSQITNRRRTVIKTAEVQSMKVANRVAETPRNIEIDSQSATKDHKNKIKRRLEL